MVSNLHPPPQTNFWVLANLKGILNELGVVLYPGLVQASSAHRCQAGAIGSTHALLLQASFKLL